MRRIFPLIACLLAVLWLPATLHCGLETAGLWLHEHGLESADTGCAESCEKDNCALVEDGAFKNVTHVAKVNAPVLALCVTQLVLVSTATEAAAPLSSVSPDTTDSPPELARTWQFIARTALLPGAPSYSV
ncbi:MAG: hypothetical protein K0R17_2963 [Rariglobus sp.]|jgi:hypothetical protein|nr:hypothetical protein [Rariglobus sp.]